MTDAPVTFTIAPAGDVLALDLWGGGLPALDPALRLFQVEPRRWWLISAGERAVAITASIGDYGALVPIGGGLMRATMTGPGWRWLLTVSGCFDVENARFGPGRIAATTIHHVPVWIAVTHADACEVYLPASYAATLTDLWTRALGTAGPPGGD